MSIPEEYYDAVRLEGGAWAKFRHVIVPLSRNATFTVILLSFIGGLRTFDLIWTMTRGGPGFTTDVIASTIYKQYQAGFYGLATAGNVHPVHRVDAPRVPDDAVLHTPRDRAVRAVPRRRGGGGWTSSRSLVAFVVFVVPFVFILVMAAKDRAEAARFEFTSPTEWRLLDNLARGPRRAERPGDHGDAQQHAPDRRLGAAHRPPGRDGRRSCSTGGATASARWSRR